MVAAGVLALLIFGGLVWGGWYFSVYYPPMHNLESDYSGKKDSHDLAVQEYERDKAAGKAENVLSGHLRTIKSRADDKNIVWEAFYRRYGRSPSYLKPHDRY